MIENRPPIDRSAPSVPVEYARVVLDMAAERGISRETMLAGLGIPPGLIEQDGAALSIDQNEALMRRGFALGGSEGGLAYELGLRMALTTHVRWGYALLSQMTFGDAVRFCAEFSRIITPIYQGTLLVEDDFAVIDISINVPVEEHLSRYVGDLVLTSVWSGLRGLWDGFWPDVELWFNYPEPEHYAAYRERLPACRFDMGAYQICFPAAQLAKRISTGDPVMAKLMIERATRECAMRAQQGHRDIVTLVSEKLVRTVDGYPDQEAVAAQLFMSSRTLKRRLQQAGSGFLVLLDTSRHRDAVRLLNESSASIEDIASWIGFAEPANFTHAFRRWTGVTPSDWRRGRRSVIPGDSGAR